MNHHEMTTTLNNICDDANELERLSDNGNLNALFLCLLERRSDLFPRLKRHTLTLEMAMIAVSHDGELLEHIPDAFKSRTLCLAAVWQDLSAIAFVPKQYLDQSFIDYALAQFHYCGRYFVQDDIRKRIVEALPQALLTDWHYHALVNIDGCFLEHIPKEAITSELCFAAVKANGKALEYVPDDLKDKGLCYMALSTDTEVLCYVPHNLRDEHCERLVSSKQATARFF